MITIVSPTFLKQEAKKLKKSLCISHHKALDETSKKFGFANFRHFLNFYEKSKSNEVNKKFSCKESSLIIQPKALSHQDSKMSFHEQLEILNLYQHTDDIQSTCKKWNLMKDEIQSALFNEFLTEVGEYEIQFRHPYFIAKEISLNELEYEIKGDMLCIDGEYDLSIKFDSDDIPEHYQEEPHFKDRMLSGSFGIKIDQNKAVTIHHLNIIEIIDRVVYAGTLKPLARLIPAFSLG